MTDGTSLQGGWGWEGRFNTLLPLRIRANVLKLVLPKQKFRLYRELDWIVERVYVCNVLHRLNGVA